MSILRIVLVLIGCLMLFTGGYLAGQEHCRLNASKILQAQWQGETKRLRYAYEMTDHCSSDQCLKAWSELIGDVKTK